MIDFKKYIAEKISENVEGVQNINKYIDFSNKIKYTIYIHIS